jgi:hypothetical protein
MALGTEGGVSTATSDFLEYLPYPSGRVSLVSGYQVVRADMISHVNHKLFEPKNGPSKFFAIVSAGSSAICDTSALYSFSLCESILSRRVFNIR